MGDRAWRCGEYFLPFLKEEPLLRKKGLVRREIDDYVVQLDRTEIRFCGSGKLKVAGWSPEHVNACFVANIIIDTIERRGRIRKEAPLLPWVDALKPAGASNSYAALMRALQDPLRPDTIVMLSDGIPRHCSWRGRNYSEPEQILAEVRRANRTALVRIHTVGMLGGIPRGDEMLDQESAVSFLRRLASENEGTYREVR